MTNKTTTQTTKHNKQKTYTHTTPQHNIRNTNIKITNTSNNEQQLTAQRKLTTQTKRNKHKPTKQTHKQQQ